MYKIRKLTARRCTPRTIEVKLGIIHHTGSRNDLANYLANPQDKAVSVHFHINQAGEIAQYTNLIELTASKGWAKQAWHAGVSRWKTKGTIPLVGLNKHAIGIELAGDGNRWHYTEDQYEALKFLIEKIGLALPVLQNPNNWVGHQHTTPPVDWYPKELYLDTVHEIVSKHSYYNNNHGRKPDPGVYFDWERFYAGFGHPISTVK